ncbi:MAG: heavy metal translocating P-type ATPase [Carboxydocellales bacterium]
MGNAAAVKDSVLVEEHLIIHGLQCHDCADKVEEEVSKLRGLAKVKVDYKTTQINLIYDPEVVDREEILAKIQSLGYQIEGASKGKELKLTTFRLGGLDCADCAAKLEKKISQLEGIKTAKVNFGASKLTVEHDIALTKIIKTIEEAGYGVEAENTGQKTKDSVFRLSGLDCADCAAKLEKKLIAQPLVEEAKVNFATAKLTIRYSGTVEEVIRTVEEAGYGAELEGQETTKVEKSFWQKNRKTILTAISGILVGTGFILSSFGTPEAITIPIYLLAMLTGGFYTARSGFYSLKTLSLDMNFLMSVAAIGAAAIGEWLEGATVVFLFSLGNTLQAYTMEKTRNSIRALMGLSPKEALVRRNGKEMRLPLNEIEIGDIIIVKPGERIAMDGKVTAGTSGVNQAPITGESMPIKKKPGDEVFAGTITEQGSLDIEVTKLVEDTTLSKIIQLVEEAQAQKAPSQQFVDVFAKYYTPAVIFTAVAIAALPSLIFGAPFVPWFKKALILLVIACPCALVISTPVAIVAAIGSAAKKGVLIKGGAYLEAAGALNAIAFDKTGTLTTGRPEVTDIVPVGNRKPEEIIEIAAVIETRSQHPLADAILRYVRDKNIPIREGADFESITGKGAKINIDGKSFYIGNPRLFEELGVDFQNQAAEIARLQKEGKTVMLVGDAHDLYGLAAVADVVRETSIIAVQKLKEVGIKKVIMLTGDNRGTAQAISENVGVDEFRAELLPEDKLNVVKDLLSQYGKVGMVGDGVNDAPALASATVGIAMGGAGTDTALETADIVLMADDLSKLPYAIKLSRKALRVIKENITFALVVKGIFLVLTFMGMANLWMAVFADTGAALLVIANGMRLFKVTE